MDFKNTIPAVAASAESVPISNELHGNQPTTDLDEVIDSKSSTEHVEFIFGNGAAAIAPTNGNNDHKNHHHHVEDDSGPETDVDALDEAGAQVSPIEDFISEFVHKNGDEMRSNVVVEPQQHIEDSFSKIDEQPDELAETKKNGDYHNADEEELVTEKATNPFFNEEEAIDDKFDSFHITTGQLINDNKFLDTVHEDAGGFQANDEAELVESVRKAIDFSEKKEFSFEREEFEKEVDSLADVQSAMQEAFGDVDVHQNEASSGHSDAVLSSPIPMDSSAEDEGIEVNAVSDEVAGIPFVGVGESLTVDDLQALQDEDEEPYLVIESQHVDREEHSSFIAPETEHGKFYFCFANS